MAFYWRIFTKAVRVPTYILAGITVAWGVVGVGDRGESSSTSATNENIKILVTLFQCNPVRGYWDRNIPSHCIINGNAYYIAMAIPNILTDAALLLLPLPFILRLNRDRSTRIALVCVFLMGGLYVRR